MRKIDDIVADFQMLDDWEDRYRFLIELGRELPRLPEGERIDAHKVQGCASQVWLIASIEGNGPGARLIWRGESDAHIVQGLVALLLALYSGHSARDIASLDPFSLLRDIGLEGHLTPQRSNGLRSMVERIRSDASRVAASAA